MRNNESKQRFPKFSGIFKLFFHTHNVSGHFVTFENEGASKVTSASHIVSVTMQLSAYEVMRATVHYTLLCKMPECQAFGCVNRRGEEGAGKGKRYYVIPDGKRFPEKRELSQKWLNNIGTGHTVNKFTFGKHKVVCENHFRPESFEVDFRASLMGEKERKILKSDAVPEVFIHRVPK